MYCTIHSNSPLASLSRRRHLSVDAESLAEAAQLRSENESLKTELKSMTDCYKLSRDNVSLREKALQDCRTEKNLLEGEVEVRTLGRRADSVPFNRHRYAILTRHECQTLAEPQVGRSG